MQSDESSLRVSLRSPRQRAGAIWAWHTRATLLRAGLSRVDLADPPIHTLTAGLSHERYVECSSRRGTIELSSWTCWSA
jgi:hypothetical protein